MVLKKSVKTDQFVQRSNWILRIYKYVMVLKKSEKMTNLSKVQTGYCVFTSMFVFVKWNVSTWDEYYLSYPYFPTIHVPYIHAAAQK